MKIILLVFLIFSFSYSNKIPTNAIDSTKGIIQIGTFVELSDAKKLLVKLSRNNDFCIEKLQNYTIYIVNINKIKLDLKIKKIKKIIPDAFVIEKQNFWNNALIYDVKFDQTTKHQRYKKQKISTINKKKLAIKKPVVKYIVKKKVIINKYKTALNYFRNRNFKKSFELFEELFFSNLKDVNINFYMGRSAFELKQYQNAIVAFERVLFEKPNSYRTKFEIARSYFYNNSYVKAKKIFTELSNIRSIPKNIVKTINSYLNKIDNKIKKHFFDGVVVLGVNYETNLNNKSKHNIYNNVYIPSFNTFLDMNNTTERINGYSHQEIFMLNYIYKYNDLTALKNSILLFNKSMFNTKYSSKNTKFLSYTPSFIVDYSSRLKTEYKLFLDNMWQNNDSYVYTYGFNPQINYIINNLLSFDTSFKYQVKKHTQANSKMKNSNYYEIMTNLIYMYSSDNIINPFAIYSQERVDSSSLESIDNNSYSIGLSNTYIYNSRFIFNPIVSYKKVNFIQKDRNYLKKAHNKLYKIGINTNYIYDADYIVQSNLNYTNQVSNIKPNEYDKYSFGINISRTF